MAPLSSSPHYEIYIEHTVVPIDGISSSCTYSIKWHVKMTWESLLKLSIFSKYSKCKFNIEWTQASLVLNTLNPHSVCEWPPDTGLFFPSLACRSNLARRQEKQREAGNHSSKSPAVFTWNWFQSTVLRATISRGEHKSENPPTHTPTTKTWMECFPFCCLRQLKTGSAHKHRQMVHWITSLVFHCTWEIFSFFENSV